MTIFPGVTTLRRYLARKKLTANAFARENSLDVSEVYKLVAGKKRRITVKIAADIEAATGGAVPIRAWIPKRKRG